MIILDANVIGAFLDDEHRYHVQASELMRSLASEYLALPAITWAEILVGALKADQVNQVEDVVKRKLGIMIVSEESAEWPFTVAMCRFRTGLKMPDAVVLATAEILDGKLVTFDEKLSNIAAKEGRLNRMPKARRRTK